MNRAIVATTILVSLLAAVVVAIAVCLLWIASIGRRLARSYRGQP